MKKNINVVLISIDALMPEFLFGDISKKVKLPNLKKYFVENGSCAKEGVQSVFPTYTYPCHQTIITGTNPNKHGLTNNCIFDPKGIHKGAWNWIISDKVQNLWEESKNNGYISASASFPASAGAKGDFIAPEFWFDGTYVDSLLLNQICEPKGLIAEMEKDIGPYASGYDLTNESDSQRAKEILWLLDNKLSKKLNEKPFFISGYFASYDESAHNFGTYSKEAIESLEKIDTLVGEIIEKAKKITQGNVVTCIVSDHGSIDNKYNIYPNVIFRENGLIDIDEKGNVIDWEVYSQRAGGTCEIRLKDNQNKTIYNKVKKILDELKLDDKNGIDKILSNSDCIDRGGFKDADFAIIAKKGYEIRNDVIGKYLSSDLVLKATHGYNEFFPHMHSSFMIEGINIEKGKNITNMKLIDIAPTLANIMGFKLKTAEGQPVLDYKKNTNIENLSKNNPTLHSFLTKLSNLEEITWINPQKVKYDNAPECLLSSADIEDARERLVKFAPYILKTFSETSDNNGLIESPLKSISNMKDLLNHKYDANISGNLLLKMDNQLPISGSVKARGGIYEVLKYAEDLAINNCLITPSDDYSIFNSEKFKQFFNQYTIQVGSTGNLGLSIGIISSKLGFKTIVHMSSDAKQWKKQLLREKGVKVIEYKTDYVEAVTQGKKESLKDPTSYFVDDENSKDLFLGYSVAGKRLENQLKTLNINISKENPLFVYLPCGIGGAPGGIGFGLKKIFKDNVHIFFEEPTNACSMLLGMMTSLNDKISVTDINLNGKTEADGLAVSRPSGFVGQLMEPYLSGISTINDSKLFVLMKDLLDSEDLFIEPSACAGFATLIRQNDLDQYIFQNNLSEFKNNITHIVWGTGGNMVPKDEVKKYLVKAEKATKGETNV